MYKTGICIDCNNDIERKLINKRCMYHYKIFLAKRSKNKKKQSKTFKGSSGQLSMFEEIFEERNKICFVTGISLQPKEYYMRNNNFHWLFHHVLPKGLYSRFKLFKPNIVLLLPEVHFDVENMAESDLIAKYPGYYKLVTLKEELKQEYNGKK